MPPYLLVILIFTRLIIAVQLTRAARRKALPNLLWLAAFFYLTSTGDVALFFGLTWIFGLGVGLGEIVMVMFIHQTFYRDRRSPYLIFLAIALADTVINFQISFDGSSLLVFSPFNWLWLMIVAYQSYKQIAADKSVEDWIKARYKLIIAYSVAALGTPMLTLLGLVAPLFPLAAAVLESLILAFVILGSLVTFVVLEYLAWAMPEAYRRFLNRNYQPIAQNAGFSFEMSEEEILRKFQASES